MGQIHQITQSSLWVTRFNIFIVDLRAAWCSRRILTGYRRNTR